MIEAVFDLFHEICCHCVSRKFAFGFQKKKNLPQRSWKEEGGEQSANKVRKAISLGSCSHKNHPLFPTSAGGLFGGEDPEQQLQVDLPAQRQGAHSQQAVQQRWDHTKLLFILQKMLHFQATLSPC